MLNKATLIGHLGNEPEVRYLPNGDAVANFSLATTRRWKDKHGNKAEATEWHRIVMFRRLAEIAGEYLKKGSKVYLEGRIQTRKYQKDGVDHYTTEIIAEEMVMLDTKQDGGNATQGENPKSAPDVGNYDDFDDDIPF